MPIDDKPPAFQFYVNDFASDGVVEAMTTEGVGAYILLLCKAWREEPPGSLPNDDTVLARWARLAPDHWAEVKQAVLRAFMARDDNRLHQKRMQKEYRKLLESRANRKRSGKAGASARWGPSSVASACDSHSNAIAHGNEDEDDFEVFWKAFPKGRKTSKGGAREAFRKATAKAEVATIIAAATAYANSEVGRGKYVKMPSTWLNQECWNDDPAAWQDKDTPVKERPWVLCTPGQIDEMRRKKEFKEGPTRHTDDETWVFGVLRDGSKVECKNYPPRTKET